MTIEEMKEKKRERGYTYEKMAKLSGVPLGTIQKIFSGETKSPRYDTLQALESLFAGDSFVAEEAAYHTKRPGEYTIDDYYALPEDERVELIDGVFFEMLSPRTFHQELSGEIYFQITSYIRKNKGECKVFYAPVDVQLDKDNKTMVQPDVMILCDMDKRKDFGIYGAPDFVLEVVSPSTKKRDFGLKLGKYIEAGVREYWIVDPYQKRVLVYYFEGDVYPEIYGFSGEIPVNIYDGKLKIDVSEFEELLSHYEAFSKEEK